MVVYFQTQNPKICKFWSTLKWNFWYISQPFGILCGHLVYFGVFALFCGLLVCFLPFGMFNQEKSGKLFSKDRRSLSGISLSH
jgi:hypothetical protein